MNMQLLPKTTYVIFDSNLKLWIGRTGGPVQSLDDVLEFETKNEAEKLLLDGDTIYKLETVRTITNA